MTKMSDTNSTPKMVANSSIAKMVDKSRKIKIFNKIA